MYEFGRLEEAFPRINCRLEEKFAGGVVVEGIGQGGVMVMRFSVYDSNSGGAFDRKDATGIRQ